MLNYPSGLWDVFGYGPNGWPIESIYAVDDLDKAKDLARAVMASRDVVAAWVYDHSGEGDPLYKAEVA